jgi:hypothetical protein
VIYVVNLKPTQNLFLNNGKNSAYRKRNSRIHLRPRFKMHLEKDALSVLESFKAVVKREDNI